MTRRQPEDDSEQTRTTPVERTLALLTLLARAGDLRLADARAELQVGQATAHRLLTTLVTHGFAIKDPATRRYYPGSALLELGRPPQSYRDLVTAARPVLARLADQTGETVHLGVLEGTQIRYLDAITSTSAVRVTARSGESRPAHATSLGKAMLVCMSDLEIRSLYAGGGLPSYTPTTITEVDALLLELAQVRRVGYAHNRGEVELGVCSIAMTIPDRVPRGAIRGLSIAAPQFRWSSRIERQYAKLLRETVGTLTMAEQRQAAPAGE